MNKNIFGLNEESIRYLDKVIKEKYEERVKSRKLCIDFNPDCFEDETCERGQRLKDVLDKDVVRLIKSIGGDDDKEIQK